MPPRALLLSATVAACATAPVAETTHNRETRVTAGTDVVYTVETTQQRTVEDTTIAASVDGSWAALVAAFQDLGLQVSRADPAARVVQVSGQRFRHRMAGETLSTFFNCGLGPTGPLTSTHSLLVTVNSQVVPAAGGGSSIRTQARAVAQDPSTPANRTSCSTRGTLERRIADEVRRRAQ